MNSNTKLVTLFAILTLSVSNTYAAFPVKNEPPTTTTRSQELLANNLRDGLINKRLSETRNHLSVPTPAPTAPQARKGGGMAMASFACGLAGLFIAGIPLGILAIIFGVIGLSSDRPMQGFAIVGTILGAAAIIGALIAIASMG